MLLLRTLGWLMCVIYSTIPAYWLLIHPFADYWRSRVRSPFRILLPVWICMWIAIGFASAPWRHETVYETPLSWIPAVALLAAGLWLYKRSASHFSARQLSGLPEILPGHREHKLATGGIRGQVRHPVYLAHLCEMLAWSIGTGLTVCFALTLLAIATGALMIRVEDAELERRFGDAYREYRRSVPAVLPRLLPK